MDKKYVEEVEKDFYHIFLKSCSEYVGNYLLCIGFFMAGAYIAFRLMKKYEPEKEEVQSNG